MNHHLFTGWRKSSHSNSSANCVEVATAASWRKSSFSNSSANCVEVAPTDQVVGVRDSKQDGEGPVLEFTASSWQTFLDRARAGEFSF
jgi:hypothetical protein